MSEITTDRPAFIPAWQALAECQAARSERREISDAAALTIASWWQSPGRDGRAFAQLASTGAVDWQPLADDIHRTYVGGSLSLEHKLALDMLATWAMNHPSRVCRYSAVCDRPAVTTIDCGPIGMVRACQRCAETYEALSA